MEPILLAYVGIALMTGLTFISSSWSLIFPCWPLRLFSPLV